MARRVVLRSSAAGGPLQLTLVVATAVVLLSGCSGAGADAPPATTGSGPTTPAAASAGVNGSPAASGSTTSAAGFDCRSVDAARKALDDAYADELDRLDVRRGDPRAQSVYALVTTTQGPAYYSAVLAAAPAEVSGDAQLVLDYYRQLSTEVGDLEVEDGSEQSLADAMDRLDAATLALDPAPSVGGDEVVAAQERLQAEVERSCSGPDASSSPTRSPTPTSSTTTTG